MPHRGLRSALFVLTFLCAPALATAQTPRRVGVVVSLGVNVEPAEQRALAATIGETLAAELPVDVIAGADTERRLPPGGLPEDCVAKPECRADLGNRLDADELLFLVIVRLGDSTQIDATWADVHSGEVVSRPRMKLEPGTDQRAYFAGAAGDLLPHIEVPEPTNTTTREIVVVPGGQTVVSERDDGRRMTTASWIAAGAAAAAAIGGTVFTVSAKRKYDALDEDGCRDVPTPPCTEAEIDSLERHALAADILYGAAIAGGVTALVLYLSSAPDGEGLSVAPTRGGAAVSWEGRF